MSDDLQNARVVLRAYDELVDGLRAEIAAAYDYAMHFLQVFCENNLLGRVDPLPTLCGVLTQIDNATTVIRARDAEIAALREAPAPAEALRAKATDIEDDPRFEAVWQAIKTWDIGVPAQYGGYCRATGTHVRTILAALKGSPAP